jgi:hypothetical protein
MKERANISKDSFEDWGINYCKNFGVGLESSKKTSVSAVAFTVISNQPDPWHQILCNLEQSTNKLHILWQNCISLIECWLQLGQDKNIVDLTLPQPIF